MDSCPFHLHVTMLLPLYGLIIQKLEVESCSCLCFYEERVKVGHRSIRINKLTYSIGKKDATLETQFPILIECKGKSLQHWTHLRRKYLLSFITASMISWLHAQFYGQQISYPHNNINSLLQQINRRITHRWMTASISNLIRKDDVWKNLYAMNGWSYH